MMADTVQFQEWIDHQTAAGWPVCITSYLREHPDHVRLDRSSWPESPSGSDWEAVANYLRIRPVLDRATLSGSVFTELFVGLLAPTIGNAFAEHFRNGFEKVLADFDDIVLARHEPSPVQMLNEPYEVLLSKSRGPTDLLNRVASEITTVPRVSTIFDGTAPRPEKRFTIPVGYVLTATLAMEAQRTRTALYDLFQREKLWLHGAGAKAKFALATEETFAYWDLFGYYFDGVNRAIEYITDHAPLELTAMAIQLLNRRGFDARVKG